MRKLSLIPLTLIFACFACAEPPADVLLDAPKVDPQTAQGSYWLSQPAAATVYADDYDKLWNICSDLARDELFTLDRQDYRDGFLITQPLVSKQIFEPWRPDTGDFYGVVQNSLQTIRRTIHFEFDKLPGGYIVTPKVVVERFSQHTKRVTSTAQYHSVFSNNDPLDVTRKQYEQQLDNAWYAIGRDPAMEAKLAKAIKQKLGPS